MLKTTCALLVIGCLPRLTPTLKLGPPTGEPDEWATALSEISAPRISLTQSSSKAITTFGTEMSYNATKKRLAVLLVGTVKHMLFKTKLENVVEPARARGWDVDVFMEIVGLGGDSGVVYIPVANSTMEDSAHKSASELIASFKESLDMRGARLVHGVVLEEDYIVAEDVKSVKDLYRFGTYDPVKSSFGQNVLRRFKGLQTLMNVAIATNDYDFVLVTRDTDLWLDKLDLSKFPDIKHPAVFTKNCKTFDFGTGAVNDKTFLFTGTGAEKVLPHVYGDFFNATYHVLDGSANAETYWYRYITEVHGVESLPTISSDIPTADATWLSVNGKEELCVKGDYLCLELKSTCAYPICPNTTVFWSP